MATYNITTFEPHAGGIMFSVAGAVRFIILDVDAADTFNRNDTLSFGANFSTLILNVTPPLINFACSISKFKAPVNDWNFVSNTVNTAGENNQIRFSVSVSTGGSGSRAYMYANSAVQYNDQGTWRNISWQRDSAGKYYNDDDFYSCPCIIIRNKRSGKYLILKSTNNGCVTWDSVDPHIGNQGGIPTAFLASTAYDTSSNSVVVYDEISIDAIVEDADDPFAFGGTSGTGGGQGTFSGTGDAITIPSLPTLSATDAGFITIFNPSMTQLNALASYMWNDPGFDIDTFRRLFADPMNCILGLSIVPVNVQGGGTKEVKVGNISTGVHMTYASGQYVEVDCGSLDVKEYWGAYLDYDPYTKAEIYLPYCGTHPLSVDDIMGKVVHVVYHVDILSGACCAYVKCGSSVLYSFIGQCSSSVPVSANDWTNVINGVLSIAGSVGTMVATGGATAPMALGNIASTAVNSLKPTVEKSGSMSGTGGMLGVQTPYLILTRPRQALPAKQNTFMGYPSFITVKLSDLWDNTKQLGMGYTEVESIHLENINATGEELTEIETILKSGVIF